MTTPNISNPLWSALEDLEDDFMELAGEIRRKLIDWTAAVARGELSLDELKELLEGERGLLAMTMLQKKVETKTLLNTLRGNLLDTMIEVVEKAL